MPGMPTRRAGRIGLAITLWELWRRLPKEQRQQVWRQLRAHAPRAARELQKRAREAKAAWSANR